MLEGGDMKYMRQLRMGDRVLTIDPNGNPRFDDIFIFGEKDADAVAPYIQLTLRQLETNRQAIFTCACAPLRHLLVTATSCSACIRSWLWSWLLSGLIYALFVICSVSRHES